MSFWFLSDGIIKRGFLFIRQMTGKVKCIGCGIYFTKNHKLQTYCHRKCFLNSYKNVRRSREMVKMPTLQMQDNEKWHILNIIIQTMLSFQQKTLLSQWNLLAMRLIERI